MKEDNGYVVDRPECSVKGLTKVKVKEGKENKIVKIDVPWRNKVRASNS
jgi:hypothetical protein